MTLRRSLLALLVVAITACSRSAPPPPADAQPPAAKLAPQQQAPAETAGDAAPLMTASLVEGRDYEVIANGGPFATPAGQVEVVEFFNYACPACNAFEPRFEQWKRSLPPDVHVVLVPLDFRADFVPYARAFYAAQALAVADQSHEAVYKAIHETHKLPGEGVPVDASTLAQFYAQFGADPAKFKQLMGSDEVIAKVAAGREYAKRCLIHGTPSLVIGGKYVVKGESWEAALDNATQLIVKAR